MNTDTALSNTHESDQTAKAIQQAFTHFSYLFLTLDKTTEHLAHFQIYKQSQFTFKTTQNTDQLKINLLSNLFIRMLKLLYFDPACQANPNSHMTIYIPRFIEKFCQSLLKFENNATFLSRTKLLAFVYSLLNICETILKKSVCYSLRQDTKFIFLNTDSVLSQKKNISKDQQLELTVTGEGEKEITPFENINGDLGPHMLIEV